MVISAVTPNTVNTNTSSASDPVSAIVSSSSSPQVAKAVATTAQQQTSAVVSISQQARALSNAANTQDNQVQAANNPVAEQRETRPAEAAEKPGIQLLEGEKNNTPAQGTRVNTYV